MSEQAGRSGVLVLPAARADGAVVARILAEAFAQDEHTLGLLPPDHRDGRLRRLMDLMVGESFAAGGHVWLALDEASKEPLAAALWEAPGCSASLAHRLAHVPAYVRIFGGRVRDALRTDGAVADHRPRMPHWYLKDIGSTPQARGRGAASSLLNHRIAEADAAGTGIYLESSSRGNVGYYQRFGFVQRSIIPATGTTDLIGMWREPAV